MIPDQIEKAPTMSEIAIRDAYTVTMDAIATYADSTAGLEATTQAGYELVRGAVADLRGMRGRVEKTRKELKADALAYCRTVDAAARELKEAIEAIEIPLKEKKAAVDDAKEREREAKRLEAKAKVEAELQAEFEAEQARIAEEVAEMKRQQAESDRIAAEAVAQAEAAEQLLAAEREKTRALEAEAAAEAQRKIDEENERIAAEERAAELQAAKERQARLAAERAEVEAELAAEAKARAEALLPDAEKLAAYADALLAVNPPEMSTDEGAEALLESLDELNSVARSLRAPLEAS